MARRPENQEVLKRNFSTNKTQSGRLTYGKQRAGSTTALAAAAAAPTRVPTQLNLMDGNGGLFPQHSTKQNNLWKTSICNKQPRTLLAVVNFEMPITVRFIAVPIVGLLNSAYGISNSSRALPETSSGLSARAASSLASLLWVAGCHSLSASYLL